MKRKNHGNADHSSGGKRIKLKSLNHLITCRLCKGYLIEAATVTECLHTFCKSCIVKYLESHNTCPECSILIHHSHPLHYISLDRTLQDVVYKLVPNLLLREREREAKFYRRRGLQPPPREDLLVHLQQQQPQSSLSQLPTASASSAAAASTSAASASASNSFHGNHGNGATSHHQLLTRPAFLPTASAESADCCHRGGEQVSLELVTAEPKLKQIERMYIRLSALATVTHVKKFIAMQVFADASRFREIDLTCDNQLLGKDHSLKFVVVTRAARPQPLTLHYCMKLQF